MFTKHGRLVFTPMSVLVLDGWRHAKNSDVAFCCRIVLGPARVVCGELPRVLGASLALHADSTLADVFTGTLGSSGVLAL